MGAKKSVLQKLKKTLKNRVLAKNRQIKNLSEREKKAFSKNKKIYIFLFGPNFPKKIFSSIGLNTAKFDFLAKISKNNSKIGKIFRKSSSPR